MHHAYPRECPFFSILAASSLSWCQTHEQTGTRVDTHGASIVQKDGHAMGQYLRDVLRPAQVVAAKRSAKSAVRLRYQTEVVQPMRRFAQAMLLALRVAFPGDSRDPRIHLCNKHHRTLNLRHTDSHQSHN